MKKLLFAITLGLAITACQGNKPESGESASPKAEESHEGHEHADHEPAAGDGTTLTPPSKEERIAPTEGARVFFVNLEDGATVTSPVHVEMGVEGMTIEPAGAIVLGAGHHHILINDEDGQIPSGDIVPMDENNIHFGKGQTSYDMELAPGSYKISLQFANSFHESYGEQMATSITITVE